MATSTSDHEKQDINYVEHVKTNDSSMNLRKEQTLSGVDMKSTAAYIIGNFPRSAVHRYATLSSTPSARVADSSGSLISFYFTGGSGDNAWYRLVTDRQRPRHRCNLSICWISPNLFGKRYIALFGSFSICLSCALVGSAQGFAKAIVGMVLSGVGAAIGELTGLVGSILNFFPITFTSVYKPDPVNIGLRAMPPALTTAISAILFNAGLSVFPGHAIEVLLVALILMACFAGSLVVMTPKNEQLL
ncbi:transmembrane transport [Ascochyta rabiei]|uniref:Transmembrane transport n=1 Tax=Didymella rabiei TaxID=5454 RepID=A0A163IFY6_DIDRA|nr:transmembrane transport [Ascochyta rabiei]